MRTPVALTASQVEALDRLAKGQGRSRASLVREAVNDYLGQHCVDDADKAFGLWGNGAGDGLALQEQARSER
jgi:hypothetical protein